MKKRILCILLAVLVVLTLSACKKKDKESAPTPMPTVSAAPSPVADVIPNAVLHPPLTPAPTAHPSLTPAPTPQPTRSPALETPMPLTPATSKPDDTAQSASSSTPAAVAAAQKTIPIVTKQPNSEGHYIGESAVFITAGKNWTSLHWTAVSSSGREIDMESFRKTFPDCSVIGEKDTTLTITNLNIDMNGWSFYCTFENEGETVRTDSARLRVRDPNSESSGSSGSSGTAVTTKSKRLRCPSCGSEVPRDLLNCPYCGAEIYTANEYAFVEKDEKGDIYYMDNTGIMFYDSSDHTSTYMDTNTNYTVFNDSGLIQSGNLNKEQEEAEKQAILNALLTGTLEGLP